MKKQIFIIIFVTLLAYLNIFNNQLVVDDHIFVGKYHPNIIQAFSGAVPIGHEGVYRPIRGIFYTIYNQFWGTNPIGYHINSLLVHLLSTILVYLIVKELQNVIPVKTGIQSRLDPLLRGDDKGGHGDDKGGAGDDKKSWLPFTASLLFGLHPIHTETITYIASGMDAIGIVFFLLAFYLYLKNKILPSVAFSLLAFFTTEMALTLPILIVFYDWIAHKLSKKRIIIYSWFGVATLFYIIMRFAILHITTRGPYLANSFFLTMLTMTKVLLQYIWILIWPVNLASNHIISPGIEAFVYRNYQTMAISQQSIFDLDILISIIIIIFLVFIIFTSRKKYSIVSFSIGWFFISLLPVMELIPQGSMMNEKSLYIASFGFVLLLAYGLLKLKKWGKLWIVATVLIAVFYGGKTIVRNQDWQNDVTLWQADVRQNPGQNAYARFALGNAYNDRKDYQKAINEYAKSVEINPEFAVGWASLGRTYADMGKIPEAIANYKRALEIDPNFWEVKNNLNNIYKQL